MSPLIIPSFSSKRSSEFFCLIIARQGVRNQSQQWFGDRDSRQILFYFDQDESQIIQQQRKTGLFEGSHEKELTSLIQTNRESHQPSLESDSRYSCCCFKSRLICIALLALSLVSIVRGSCKRSPADFMPE
jgi:hypothetical protein